MSGELSFALKVAAAWGPGLPGWVTALADAADTGGLKQAARLVGYSPAAISQVLANKYQGNLAAVERRVEGAILAREVACPVLGAMRRDTCLDWQAKAKAPGTASSLNVRMGCACRDCIHSDRRS